MLSIVMLYTEAVLYVHRNRILTYKASLLTMIEKSREGRVWGLRSPNCLFVAVAVGAVSECLLIVLTDFQVNTSFRLR